MPGKARVVADSHRRANDRIRTDRAHGNDLCHRNPTR
jgi:hypothetical protein